MSIAFDPIEVFAGAATEAAAAALKETVGAQLASAGFSAVFASVSEEAAKSIALSVMGPVLNTFLKLLDPTQKKLDALLAEPLQTGLQLANQAMRITGDDPVDVRLRGDLFAGALQSLEKAFSYAQSRKMNEECQRIRFAQASLAKKMDAPGAVQVYLTEYASTILKHLTEIQSVIARCRASAEAIENKLTPPQIQVADDVSSYYCGNPGRSIFHGAEEIPYGFHIQNPPPIPQARSWELREITTKLEEYTESLLLERGIDDGRTTHLYNQTKSNLTYDIEQLIYLRIEWYLLDKQAEKYTAFVRFWNISE